MKLKNITKTMPILLYLVFIPAILIFWLHKGLYSTLSGMLLEASALFLGSVFLICLKNMAGKNWPDHVDRIFVIAFSLGSLSAAQLYLREPLIIFIMKFIILNLLVLYFNKEHENYTPVGVFFYLSDFIFMIFGVPWGILFVVNAQLSVFTKILMLIASPLLFFTLPFGFLQVIEQNDVFCRKRWTRPMQERETISEKMVSLHIPIYSEPPEIVIQTLNRVAEQDYKNFEVLVIDNNTKDEKLWRPVKDHCKKLGKKFRFFHVDPLPGAKAGALNFAITKTSKKANIIGVIDADYHPNPDFIRKLIGHFDDPKVGFVQTPHDYRDWENNTYLKMCYYEYKVFFHTIMVSLNERDAGLTVGTMCLLRKDAIIKAGGWATWCVTEDSEIAIRIHDAGYSSVYVPVSYGKGLIPDRFSDYTKQRYRWIAGPVQEMRHHFRRFFGKDKSTSMNLAQRLHHFHHGFGSTMFSLNIPLGLLSILLVLSMTLHNEIIPVPFVMWASVTTLFVSQILLFLLSYLAVLKVSVKEALMAALANKALSYTVNMAALNTTINPAQKWRRTNKFKLEQDVKSALYSTMSESIIGLLLLVFAIVIYSVKPYPGLLLMCLIGIVYKSIDHLAAPVVAVIAVTSQNRASKNKSPQHNSLLQKGLKAPRPGGVLPRLARVEWEAK